MNRMSGTCTDTGHKRGSAVYCIETGERYKSTKEASEATGIGFRAINHCICGRSKTAGGLHWTRAESLCLSCANALGGCTWSALHPEKDKVWFRPVSGWNATKTDIPGNPRERTSFHVQSCPQYIPDPERDLSRYKEVDEKIEREKET